MGRPIALRLIEQGWRVAVADLLPSAQAFFDENTQLVSGFIDFYAIKNAVVVLCVVDAGQVNGVLFGHPSGPHDGHHGLALRMQPGSCVIICSTISPTQMAGFDKRLASLGLDLIDAPMSGGPVRARAGTMSLMVAASEPVLSRQRSLLDAMSSQVHVVSHRIGDASKLKLVNNLLAATNLHAAASSLLLARQLGLDVTIAQAVIDESSGQSWIGQDRMRRYLVGDVKVHAQLGLLAKDTRLALGMCADAGLEAGWAHIASAKFASAVALGRAAQDDSTLIDCVDFE